jgi:GT2 family glycosyltransferase
VARAGDRQNGRAQREQSVGRVYVKGKSLYVGDSKLPVRGVTYGTFARGEDGQCFPAREQVADDFKGMAAAGINALRTYTVPPCWLLDLAAEHGLRVLMGIDWEDHMAVLEDRRRLGAIQRRVAQAVHETAGHPAVLCYLLGNEIPASIVRWYGWRRMERFLASLYRTAKREDPDALVTYANYPGTEYLRLPFLDLVSFNVYLEQEATFDAYLAHLQTIAGDQPLLVTETGLDSRSHGLLAQQRALSRQIRSACARGCAGIFLFAWTDEWYRGGATIEDWDFGLVDRQRRPKPALAAVSQGFAKMPLPIDPRWPKVSVVVCAFNAEATLDQCLATIRELRYRDYEVIVIDDGSTDSTAAIARRHGVRLLTTENQGLASARNAGLALARGEIVAYLDSDARPDPEWLAHIVATFEQGDYAGVGGPNIPPPEDVGVAECVANAPGGPIHVLLDDRRAEHIPGCNMAFRRSYLEALGGFDPQFRIAGDDVDVCWRVHDRGWAIGFAPGAVVLHNRRGSIRGYLKQQYEYGKAEALLEGKWPAHYNRLGHHTWTGSVYGRTGPTVLSPRRWQIYYGTWGTGLFQSVYHRAPSVLSYLPFLPEWHLVVVALTLLSILSFAWAPLVAAVPLLVLSVGSVVVECARGAKRAVLRGDSSDTGTRLRRRALIGALHFLQPPARLAGRLRAGLSPWRRPHRRGIGLAVPRWRTMSAWSESWQSVEARLRGVEARLRDAAAPARRGGEFDRWDLDVRGGPFGAARLRMVLEEHGAGKQMVRFRSWPRCSKGATALAASSAAVAVLAGTNDAGLVALVLGAIAVAILAWILHDCATAAGILLSAVAGGSVEPMYDAPAGAIPLTYEIAAGPTTAPSAGQVASDALGRGSLTRPPSGNGYPVTGDGDHVALAGDGRTEDYAP